ncbi:MAG: tyrosine--tRNA ligase [Chloroflexota bacterium]|nr:tyrosine--tRNA ligase [Chloroflexota bacterium]
MNIDEQVALLMQGTEYGNEEIRQAMAKELRKRLLEDRPLRVYCGYDPRTTDLHLGHTITMRKLRQFQELGHEVTFLIGTYTSLIGDPSDKDKLRPVLSPEEVERNAQTYAEQAFKILDRERTEVRYNSEWLSSLTFDDLIKLGSVFTVQQFLSRDMFRKRWDQGDPIYLHETFYALMQGYDAVAQEADVQVGGTDQLFNIIVAGRKLQEAFKQKPQVGIIMGILPGTDGVVKMSKSLGNHIPILASSEGMYGKVMSIPDEIMSQYFRLVTRWTPDQIAEMEEEMRLGQLHPMNAKKRLAWEIVDIFHGSEAADEAAEHFERVHQRGKLPSEMPQFTLSGPTNIVDLIAEAGLARSKSQARRLIQQGGVRLDGDRVGDIAMLVPLEEAVLQVGKRRFLRLVPREDE